jgi:hypothetical protein
VVLNICLKGYYTGRCFSDPPWAWEGVSNPSKQGVLGMGAGLFFFVSAFTVYVLILLVVLLVAII